MSQRYLWAAAMATGLFCGGQSRLAHAADDAGEEAAQTDAASVAEADPLEIPDGGADELHAFLRRLADTSPEGDTAEEQQAHQLRAVRTLVDAAERLLAADPTDEQAAEGRQFQLIGLQTLAQLGEEGVYDRLQTAVEEACADERDEIAGAGWQARINLVLGDWMNLSPQDRQQFAEDVVEAVKTRSESTLPVMIVHSVAGALEGGDDAFVGKLLSDAVPLLGKSENPKIRQAVEQANLLGMQRRFNLPGNPIEIRGTLLDGTEVDWASYRGKVVLVDFWATWCGPCRAEVPNILKMYEAYHDKGFDVLGVSLDKTPEQARQYIEEMGIPWASLFPAVEDERGWQHPLARYYGINGIPTALLVDQQGNVVHMMARGRRLRSELQRLLGDPLETPAEEEVEAGVE